MNLRYNPTNIVHQDRQVVLHTSLTGVVRACRRDRFSGDQPNFLYHFGCRWNRIPNILDTQRFPAQHKQAFLEMLAQAEDEGRVFLKFQRASDRNGMNRFRFLYLKMVDMGVSVPSWNDIPSVPQTAEQMMALFTSSQVFFVR